MVFIISLKQITVFINGFNSNLKRMPCDVPRGCVLRPLLFLIYINDRTVYIDIAEHHFTDDTNLLNCIGSVKKNEYQHGNQHLKNLKNWLNANKIYLNISKTELVLFKFVRKQRDAPLKQKRIRNDCTLQSQ